MRTGPPARRVDRVAAVGATVALVGCALLPFAEFRANRIVSGTAQPLGAAGAAGFVLLALAAVTLALAFAPPGRVRSVALHVSGATLLVATPWTLGAAAVRLQAGADDIARVSVGAGGWLAVLGGAIVWFAGSRGAAQRERLFVAVMVLAALVASVSVGGVGQLSLAREYSGQAGRFWTLARQHFVLSGSGLGLGALLGIPLGVAASRNRLVRDVALGVVGVIQTVPSLALLGLLVAPLSAAGFRGIGATPAIIALTLYALLPIVRNTYVGLDGVSPAALDAGRGMGMSRMQLLLRVEAPLALPLVLEGVRAAAVMVIGIAAVTAFVGAGGLGILVFQGWGQQADDLTLLGAVPMVLLAVAADASIRALAAVTVSPGIREVHP